MISIKDHAFDVTSKYHYHTHTPNHQDFPLYYLLKVLEFCILHLGL